MIARELAERRLGFYFARPLVGVGDLVGQAAGLVPPCAHQRRIGSAAERHAWRSPGAPSVRGGGDRRLAAGGRRGRDRDRVVLAHFVTIATRSRLPLVALDLGMLGVLTLTSVLALRRFFWTGASSLFTWSLVTVLVVVLVALVAGGWVAGGRSGGATSGAATWHSR